MTLVEHIAAENVKTLAWIAEDPANRGAGLVVEDPAHWAGYGITTVDEYQHYLAQADHWDTYKDIHGIRPRWVNYAEMTTEEIEAETERELDTYNSRKRIEEEAIAATKRDPVPLTHNPFANLKLE